MDLPEIRIVRRALEEQRLDPVVALAVLLRTMMQRHVQTLLDMDARGESHEPDDDLEEPTPVTMLETLHQQVKRDEEVNGEFWKRKFDALGPGAAEDALDGAAKLAGELMMEQDGVRELLATCLDAADTMYEASGPRLRYGSSSPSSWSVRLCDEDEQGDEDQDEE